MKLYGASPSHFTRKVRVVLQELGLPFQFVAVSSLLDDSPETFGSNPLLLIPVLEADGRRLVDSDLICEYLIERHGNKALSLFPREGDLTLHKQRQVIMNGGMSAGAHIMRARRSEIPNFGDYSFYKQEKAAIHAALAWLDKDIGSKKYFAGNELTLLEITLVCFADWVTFREMVPNLDPYPNLKRFAAEWGQRPSFAATHPSQPVSA